jgi:hypothetical protein
MKIERFVSLFDLHYGYERKHRKIVPLHDAPTLSIAKQFIKDFAPHHIVLGGDMLDCGAISHHNDRKPGRVEGLRIFSDAKELRTALLGPLEATRAKLTYLIGNHEGWLNQLVEAVPGLEGLVEPEVLLDLGGRWKVVPQGEKFRLGKLVFKHGDSLTGGEHIAKAAVIASERSIRFGHHHTYAVYTKVSDVDLAQKHTGVSMPCMCRKGPGYGRGKANKWINGFGWGYILPNGTFTDYVTVVVKGQAVINGTHYRG